MAEGLLFGGGDGADGAGLGAVAHGPLRLVRVAVERSVDLGYGAGGGGGGGAGVEGGEVASRGLTYLGEGLCVGARVEVPLGRGDRTAFGYVVATGGAELLEGLDPGRLKRVKRAAGPVLPEELIELAGWLSGYCVTPLGMVLGAMVPGSAKRGTGRKRVELVGRAAGAGAGSGADALEGQSARVRGVWAKLAALPESAYPAEAAALVRLSGAGNRGPINRLIAAGLLERVSVERVNERGAVFDCSRWAGGGPAPTPTWEQAAAIEAIWPESGPGGGAGGGAVVGSGGFSAHVLFGVTGSGKTEVYLRLIERCLAAGRSAIVLVPEIALTPQTAGRFVGRFGAGVVSVLHSGLSASARHGAWDAALRGESRVVVGARSAVFAPVRGLGLIVVDEEHEAGYKQESLPRYHGRDVAVKRAQLAGCPVVLGSATPSMESYANALAGRYRLHRLRARATGAKLPEVEVVDMAQERLAARGTPDAAHAGLIGPRLLSALGETLGAGGQAVVLLNRRGYAGYLGCAAAGGAGGGGAGGGGAGGGGAGGGGAGGGGAGGGCGWALTCHHCDARMVLHRAGLREGQRAAGGFLRCHHCGAERVRPRACPVCGRGVVHLGTGTQRAEEVLSGLLAERFGLDPSEHLARLDADTGRSAREMHAVLGAFAEGRVRVLLGTQMIAKGLDVANVRLVGVLNADTALHIPDFRAGERTFQLVSQVAGRAGRGEHPGRVIVQTEDPGMAAIRLAAAHDYEGFARMELEERGRFGFPPAVRMARVVCRDPVASRAQGAAAAIAAGLRESGERVEVSGPWPCVIGRIADHFRFGVEVTAERSGTIRRAMERLRAAGHLKSDARTAVDMDPVNLL